MANSADPDQLASEEANWSGSTLFAKAGYIRGQQEKGVLVQNTLAVLWENVPADVCPQRRHNSTCSFTVSDQGLRFPHEKLYIPGY